MARIALFLVVPCLVPLVEASSLPALRCQPVPARQVIAETAAGAWTVAVTADTAATGLEGAVVEATSGERHVRVPLGDPPAWRIARRVSALRLHEPSNRVLVLTDQDHDVSGLVIVDLDAGAVVTSLKARHMTLSPDHRYVAFEEFYSRLDEPWPWNETVYAVLDVTASAPAVTRPCPYDDDRCRGRLVYLPSRQETCAAQRERRGGPSCLVPGREPQHQRRSPFVWLGPSALAFVSADRVRESFAVVVADFDPLVPLAATGDAGVTVRSEPCRDEAEGGGTSRCPAVRASWTVDQVRRDGAAGRLWIHFRNRLPEVPGGWLSIGG